MFLGKFLENLVGSRRLLKLIGRRLNRENKLKTYRVDFIPHIFKPNVYVPIYTVKI